MSTLSNFNVGPLKQEYGIDRISNWHLHFCIWPRKCFFSGKKLWLKKCYAGTRVLTGPGDAIYDDYYIEESEFIFWNLRGKK